MAITRSATAQASASTATATSWQAPALTGTAVGDYVILTHTASLGTLPVWSASSYAGWTILEDVAETNSLMRVLGRRLDGTSADTFPTLTTTAAVWHQAASVAYRGVDATTPFIAESGQAHTAGASTTTATPAITNTDATAWGVAAAAGRQVATPLSFTPPSGLTKLVETTNALANTNNTTTAFFDTGAGAAAVSTTYTFTHQSTAQATVWAGFLKPSTAVTPAPVAGAGVDVSFTLGNTFTRTGTETNSPTSRSWTIVSGPTGAGTTLSTTSALNWTPSTVGTYVLRYSATNAGGTGTDDVTVTVTAALPKPGTILNIGTAAGKNHYDVQIAPGSTGSIEQHTQAEIEAGFSDANHFYTTPDGLWVVFRPRADSVTTAGTVYGRDELREVNADGSLMKFDAMSGEHILQGTTKIVHTPANDPDVVICQLHDGDADRVAIRTQMFSTGTTVLGVRINGTLHATRFQNPWVPGSSFTWKVRIFNQGTVEVYYSNMTTPVITVPPGAPDGLTQTIDPNGWYFKAGAYNQFNETDAGATGLTVAPDEYSEVHLQALSTTHNAAAVISGSGAATASGTGTGTGGAVRTGSGAGTASGTGTGSGGKVATGSGDATASGTSAGSGGKVSTGAGGGTASGTGAGSGGAVRTGAGASTASANGTGTGDPIAAAVVVSGTGAATASSTGTGAAGTRVYGGPGVSTASSTGTGSGGKVSTGSGAGTASGTGAGTGGKVTTGAGDATASSTGTGAAGTRIVSGSGGATASGTGAATGGKVATGSGLSTASSSGTGSGAAIIPSGSGTGASTASSTGAGSGGKVSTGGGAGTASSTSASSGARVVSGSGGATASSTGTGAAGVRIFDGEGDATVTALTIGSGVRVARGFGVSTVSSISTASGAPGPAKANKLRIGGSIPSAIYVGTKAVDKVYMGDTLIWP